MCGASARITPFSTLGVGHGDDVAAVRHLHGRGVGVAVDRDHLGAEALQFDGHFLAQFARAEQHDAGGRVGEGGADTHDRLRFLLPLWEKVGRSATRMRGDGGAVSDVMPPVEKIIEGRADTPHRICFADHLLPQGEKESS